MGICHANFIKKIHLRIIQKLDFPKYECPLSDYLDQS